MALVNYIWVGDLSTNNKKKMCQLGPKNLGTLSPSANIQVWVPDSLKDEAKILFKEHTNIKIRSIDKLLDGKSYAGILCMGVRRQQFDHALFFQIQASHLQISRQQSHQPVG